MSSLEGYYNRKPKRLKEKLEMGIILNKYVVKIYCLEKETRYSGRKRDRTIWNFFHPLRELVDILSFSAIISYWFKMNLIHGFCMIHLYVQNFLGSTFPQYLKF